MFETSSKLMIRTLKQRCITAYIYLFKVNSGNTRKKREMFSEGTIKTTERRN